MLLLGRGGEGALRGVEVEGHVPGGVQHHLRECNII